MRRSNPTSGTLLHLQRLSTEDGPGIRTTVFMKGCPLRCAWCHNPESLSPSVQVQWYAARCLGCLTCLEACPHGCLSRVDDELVIDRRSCNGCAACAEACPANAIEALGKRVPVDELLNELLKDRAYYEKSGGGVTLSGGEPTLQPDFAEALLLALKQAGIATALDTCGLCRPQILERLLPHTDLLLFDLKLFDPLEHQRYTGQSNQLILDNLLLASQIMQRNGQPAELWVRTPLIPGATLQDENLRQIGQFLARHLDGHLNRWELCAFNNLCRDKYTRLDMTWPYASQPLLSAEELAHCEVIAKTSGLNPDLILATGATRLAEA